MTHEIRKVLAVNYPKILQSQLFLLHSPSLSLTIDANNLYGFAMMQRLPVRDFKWLSEEEINFVKSCFDKGDISSINPCILEVDLEYPEELFEEHKDYPLAPEKLEVAKGQYKLCQTLLNKEKYVIHYKNLYYYIQKGIKLKKIHRAISFKESEFLKSYIRTCIKLRQSSKTEMEKTVWKLMVNSVFGKTMENLRKRLKVEIVVDNQNRLERLIANPFFVTADVIINDKLVSAKLRLKKIHYDRPIYVGFSILELSKLWMFMMHYEFVKSKSPDSIMMYTDTDSLIYYNPTASLEDFIIKLKDNLDLSNLPDISKKLGLDPNKNKMVPGYFKIES
jgi:hypothetical protein